MRATARRTGTEGLTVLNKEEVVKNQPFKCLGKEGKTGDGAVVMTEIWI